MSLGMNLTFESLLDQAGNHPEFHARLINTFSYLEYVGARKILRSQIESAVSAQTLSHLSEEVRHAQMLKGVALKLSGGLLSTYADEHLLAGAEAKHYIQTVDHAGASYLCTTLLLEERAMAVYPAYSARAESLGFGPVLRSIVGDEQRHLEDVERELTLAPGAAERMRSAREVERACFNAWLGAASLSAHRL